MFVPENEQGVIVSFMLQAESAGWKLLKIGSAFPDATFEYMGEEWKIEFEFNSLNFLLHKHDHRGCDAIVCLINDYADCPLPVVCLSDEGWPFKKYIKGNPAQIEIEYWKRRAYNAESNLKRAKDNSDEYETQEPKKKSSADECTSSTIMALRAAKIVICDFVHHMFNSMDLGNRLMKSNGIIVKGVVLPWTKRGEDIHGDIVSEGIRKMILRLIMETSPNIFVYNGLVRAWQANVMDYANCSDMLQAIDEAFNRIVVNVDAVIVGDEEEA